MAIHNKQSLSLEQLEDRMMLSSVQIFAAGDTGEENFDVLVNGEVAASFSLNNVAGELQMFEFQPEGAFEASDIRIEFTNDAFDAATGNDRNLTVDRIVVHGNTFFTDSETVFTNGTFLNGDFTSGFGIGDTLYTNGFFEYGQNPGYSTDLTVFALGIQGEEQFEVFVDHERVAAFSTADQVGLTAYSVSLNQPVSPGQVKVQFVNDLYLPEEGIDRNLIVDRIEINGDVFQTESPSVFTTGTYVEGIGIVSGFTGSETLHANGFFQYSDVAVDTEAPTVTLDFVEDVTEFGSSRVGINLQLADNNSIGFPNGPSPLTVIGPSGQEFVPFEIFGVNNEDGTLLVGYEVRTINTPFLESDNGTYEIFLNENAIQDSAGNFAAGGLLGTFEVNIANSPGNDLTPPTAQFLNTGAVFTDASEPVEVFTSFEDEVFIGSTSSDPLTITGPDGSLLFASFASGGGFENTLRTSNFVVFRNNELEPLTAADNGIYTVSLNENSVFDQVGNAAPGQVLGTFEIQFA